MGFNIERVNKPFVVKSPYKPSGDQPKAIEELATRIENGENDVVLMGATGTGKTATTAWLIERLQRPTLIIEPNKTLAAQLCAEFRELMPDNAVSYFVSYYDYYQPEAYVPAPRWAVQPPYPSAPIPARLPCRHRPAPSRPASRQRCTGG